MKIRFILAILLALTIVSTVSAGPVPLTISFLYQGDLVVTYSSSSAGYNNEYGIFTAGPLPLGNIHAIPAPAFGTQYTNIGQCLNGVPVVLYIKTPVAPDPGLLDPVGPKTYRSDQMSGDGVDHTRITKEGDGSFTVGFEDLWNGGDLDYNDVVLNVACTPPDPIPTPEFPTIAFPAALLVGMLGAVLFIQRTKE